MKTLAFYLIVSTVLLSVSGCQSSDTTEQTEVPSNSYQESLDKARAVEEDVLEAAERQRQAIEEQEGG